MNKIIYIIMGIMLIGIVTAQETYNYEVGKAVNIQILYNLVNGSIPSSTATCNITIYSPNGETIINNNATTSRGLGRYNFTYTFSKTGTYKMQKMCWNVGGTGVNNSATDTIEIYGIGNTSNKGITETSIYLVIAIIVCLFIYMKVSRFFGSMMIFVTGFGILFMTSSNGWIGWLVIAGGFIMLIYALLTPKKKHR